MIGLEGQPASLLDLNKYEALRGHVDIINTYVPYNPGG